LTDRARLSAALRQALLMHMQADLTKMADDIADDLLTKLGVELPALQAKPLGRRAPIDSRPAALRN
jgi:hypothetical protein